MDVSAFDDCFHFTFSIEQRLNQKKAKVAELKEKQLEAKLQKKNMKKDEMNKIERDIVSVFLYFILLGIQVKKTLLN